MVLGGWFLCAPAESPLLSLNLPIFAPAVAPGDLLMSVGKWCTWLWGLKSAAQMWGAVPAFSPGHTQRSSQRTVDEKGEANTSECATGSVRVWTPSKGSSTPCSPSCLFLCAAKATLRLCCALHSAWTGTPAVPCSLCWQFKVEMAF